MPVKMTEAKYGSDHLAVPMRPSPLPVTPGHLQVVLSLLTQGVSVNFSFLQPNT